MAIEELLFDRDDFTKKLGFQLFAEAFGTFILAFMAQASVITGERHSFMEVMIHYEGWLVLLFFEK